MSNTCNTVIESLGVYLPPKVVSTRELVQSCKNKVRLPIERLTGIKSRRMAEKEFSIDLAKRAIEICLKHSKHKAKDIDLLVCCNISRYDGYNSKKSFEMSFEPSTSVKLKKHYGFDNALVFDISNACAGVFTGINVVDCFLKTGLIRRGMVVSGEYITHLTDTALKEITKFSDSRLACLTLGDSGAAILLEKSRNPKVGFHNIDMCTLGQFSSLCIAKPTKEKHGGAIMYTDSKGLHKAAIKGYLSNLMGFLKNLPVARKAIDHIIMHQTTQQKPSKLVKLVNSFIGEKICSTKSLIQNIANRGNTSTTSHIVALWDNILNNKINSGDEVLFGIQASGLTIGSALYTFDDLPERIRRQSQQSEPNPKRISSYTHIPSRTNTIFPKIRIESIGTIPEPYGIRKDTIAMARTAAENCLIQSVYNKKEIDLLLHSGVYRKDFIAEPALAALLAGELGMNALGPTENNTKTLAFDVFNGALGFLNSCYSAIAMIMANKFNRAMVVTSEIENNANFSREKLLGIKETGSAIILDRSSDGKTGFGRFLFRSFTDYMDKFISHATQKQGTTYLKFIKNEHIESIYVDCISRAVNELLSREGLTLSHIKTIIPPQISSQFIDQLSRKMNLVKDRFIDIAEEGKDLFTSSLSYAFKSAVENKLIKPGDIGLIINAGSGIQVGCALYHF